MSPPSVDDAEQELRNLAAASRSRPPIEAVAARARSRRSRRRWTAAIAVTVSMCVGLGAVAVARNSSSESTPSVAATAPNSSGASAAGSVHIAVTPATSALDAALGIQIKGLRPGRRATVKVTSRDVKGVEWASHATFVADGDGVIDPSRLAPRAGSYSGVEPMGLIDSMSSPPSATSGFFYFWNRTPSDFRFTVSVGGRVVASTTVQRYVIPPESKLVERDFTMENDGFVGRYRAPTPGAAPHPAVLLFGGSEGGTSSALLAFSLAAQGYPTLDLAYFNAPGLPATFSNIPLEYFAGALRWLASQPGVDPTRLWVMGAWRGGEAALLLGATYPDLIHGVAALVPSNVVTCSAPCTGPSWTLGGQPVPFTRLGQPNPTDEPAAVIPVERIRGPVLTLCGGADQIAYTCDFADAVAARLQAGGHGQPHLLLDYPDAGQGVAMLIPHEPARLLPSFEGKTPTANWHAREQAWPRVLDFLAKPT